MVYIGSAYGDVIALNASSGAVLWDYEIGDPVYSSPAVANGVVYIGAIDGNFYALNASTGAQLWTDALTGYAAGFDSAAAVANGVVYIGSGDGNLYAFSLAGGLATPAHPRPSSLHPNYSLQEQRQ